MQEYTYTLQDEDYIEYLENQAISDKLVTIRSLLFTYASLPILGLAFYMMGIRKLMIYLILLLLYFVWIPESKKIIGKVFRSSIEKKLEQMGKRNYKELNVKVDGRKVQVNSDHETTEDVISSYNAFGHLMVLKLSKGNELLLPSRIFQNEKDLANLLKEINGEEK